MIEGNSPGAFIDTDVFQKGVKRAVERIDEAGSAVKKTGLEQINAEKAADAVPQPAQNAALAPARAQIRRALFRVGIDFVEMLAEIFVGVVEDVPGDLRGVAFRMKGVVRSRSRACGRVGSSAKGDPDTSRCAGESDRSTMSGGGCGSRQESPALEPWRQECSREVVRCRFHPDRG